MWLDEQRFTPTAETDRDVLCAIALLALMFGAGLVVGSLWL
jgi:hypothetical protein